MRSLLEQEWVRGEMWFRVSTDVLLLVCFALSWKAATTVGHISWSRQMRFLAVMLTLCVSQASEAATLQKIGSTLSFGSVTTPREITNVISNGVDKFSVLGNMYGPYTVVKGVVSTFTSAGQKLGTFEVQPSLKDEYGFVPITTLNGTFDGSNLQLTWIERLYDVHGVGLPYQYTAGFSVAGAPRSPAIVVNPPIDTQGTAGTIYTQQELYYPSVYGYKQGEYLFGGLRLTGRVSSQSIDVTNVERVRLANGRPGKVTIDRQYKFNESDNVGYFASDFINLKLVSGESVLIFGEYWRNLFNSFGVIYARKFSSDGVILKDKIELARGKSWAADGFTPFGLFSWPGTTRQIAAVATPDGGFALVWREGKAVEYGGGTNFYGRMYMARFNSEGVRVSSPVMIYDGSFNTSGGPSTVAVCPTVAAMSDGSILIAAEVYSKAKSAVYLTLNAYDAQNKKSISNFLVAKSRYGGGVFECDGRQQPRGVLGIGGDKFVLYWMDELQNKGLINIYKYIK